MTSINDLLKIRRNAYNISELCEWYGIIPFVGAGMSACIYPTWRNFLLHGIDLTEGETHVVEGFLDAGMYEEAASYAEHLSPTVFRENVNRIFNPNLIKRDRLTKSLLVLPNVTNHLIVTTNVDHVLEYLWKDRPGLDVICPDQRAHFTEVVVGKGKQTALLKLHGTLGREESWVLTKEQYDDKYGTGAVNPESSSQPFITTITHLFESHSMLFLGCSLESDRTLDVLQAVHTRFDALRHFAILSLSNADEQAIEQRVTVEADTDAERSALKAQYRHEFMLKRERERLDKYGIITIWYPHGDYASVDTLVSYISSKLGHDPLKIRKQSDETMLGTVIRFNATSEGGTPRGGRIQGNDDTVYIFTQQHLKPPLQMADLRVGDVVTFRGMLTAGHHRPVNRSVEKQKPVRTSRPYA
ncbi:MAG: SIR2 family protein [Propionibacteriaceae bacterium]|nr:SIR2 family protein [Propionibacteriaceae bacterium]